MIALAVLLWVLVLGIAAFVFYARYVEPARIELTRRAVHLPGLPGALDGLTLAHVADFHCQPDAAIEHSSREAVRIVMAERPDLIAMTGDTFETCEMAAQCGAQVAGLSAPLGVWAVPGNHDLSSEDGFAGFGVATGDIESLRSALADVGVTLLANEGRILDVPGARLAIAGLDEFAYGRDDAAAALAATTEADVVVALAHTPDMLDDPDLRRADLVLCGHTHGGQIQLSGLGSPWAPVWRDRRRASGLLRAGETLCYVTRGVASATRARFNCRPEVTILTLTRGVEHDATAVSVRGSVGPNVEEVVS